MKSQSPTRIALILIGALVLSGCALKPKRTSRFHQATQNGSCGCYTCQNSTGYAHSNAVVTPQPVPGTWVESSEVVTTPLEGTESFSSTPFSAQPRQPYSIPDEPDAPVVSSEPFSTNTPAYAEDQPVINEVQPEMDSSAFELPKSEEDTSIGGGSFKPLNSEDVVEAPQKIEDPIVESSKPLMVEPKIGEPTPATAAKVAPADEVAPGPIEIPKPAEIAKPTEIAKPAETVKPIETPKPAEVTKAIELPKPAAEIPNPIPDKIEIPKKVKVQAPASSFKPGEAFKPRKKSKTLDTSWLGTESFDEAQFENSPSDERVALAPEPVENSTDPVDSFFGRQSFEAKPLPQPNGNANGKVVLRANPVERNVVYCPPSRSASKVAVPALQAGFRKQNTAGNWLRGVAPERQELTRVASAETCSGGSYGANTTEIVAMAPIAEPVQPVVPPVVEPEAPKQLVVKLRAIPMSDRMVRGKRVDVRFREHQPTQNVIVETPRQQQPVASQPLTEPVVAPIVTLNPKVQLLESNPAVLDQPVLDRTARSSDSIEELVTPPWRLK